MKILITSAGSVNGVNVIKALQGEMDYQEEWGDEINPEYRIRLNLIAADADKLSAGSYMVDKRYVVPMANDEKFIPALLRICRKEKIKVLIPILSYEIPVIIENKKKFEGIGVKMAVSDYDAYKITENKLETKDFFEHLKIPQPKTYIEYSNGAEIIRNELKFPAIIKPTKDTSGAKNVHKIETKEELDFYKKKIPYSFVEEFIEGQEYTIDGLCDLKRKMLYALPRKRLEVKDGMAVKSITCYDQKLIDYTRKIVEGFGLVGAFNIQCIKRGQQVSFIEVNNRFPSGGLPLTVAAKLNIPLDIIRLLTGKKVPPFRTEKTWIYDKITMIRYQSAIILHQKDIL